MCLRGMRCLCGGCWFGIPDGGREGKGGEGKGREGKGREGKGRGKRFCWYKTASAMDAVKIKAWYPKRNQQLYK